MVDHEIPLDAFPPLYTAVGELVINWGLAESAITHILAVVFQGAGGKHLETKLPGAFKRRMRFLRLCFKRIIELKTHQPEMDAIIDMAKQLVPMRNDVTHGSLANFHPENGEYTFVLLETNDSDNFHYVHTVQVSIKNLRLATIRAQTLFDRANALGDRLNETFVT